MRPLVTLLSDFGSADTFVGQMKGVILSICPDATLVDLTHLVPPQSILSGAIHLGAAWKRFPHGTVHLAVVDPGVGTARRPIAVSYHGHTFVLPDNGLISGVIGDDPPDQAVELVYEQNSRQSISATFHGRDVFAPAAGRLASGIDLNLVGNPLDTATLERLLIPKASREQDLITGEILLIDHFGNAITNISSDELLGIDRSLVTIRCGGFSAKGMSLTYQDVDTGSPLALVSSMNTLELSVRNGAAESEYGLRPGMIVTVEKDAACEERTTDSEDGSRSKG